MTLVFPLWQCLHLRGVRKRRNRYDTAKGDFSLLAMSAPGPASSTGMAAATPSSSFAGSAVRPNRPSRPVAGVVASAVSASVLASAQASVASATVSHGVPLHTIKTDSCCLGRGCRPTGLQLKMAQLGEHTLEAAFLDIDENDPGADEWTFKSKDHPEKILDSLNDLRRNEALCDVKIRIVERDFPVHKCVIAAASNYFKAMFTSSLCEAGQDTVTINGVHPDIFELLLDYAYTSEITIQKQNVQNLLAAANLLEMLPVRDACCKYMERHMSESNCLGIKNFAEMHACPDLEENARMYSLKRFTEVVKGEEFVSISQCQLIDLISSDDLECLREEQVYEAAVRWLDAAREAREPEFHRVLAHVRLPLLSPYFLNDCVDKSSTIVQSRECLRLVEEAKRYHLLPDRRTTGSERTRPRNKAGLVHSIICVGGEDDKVMLRLVESWDPLTNIWKQLPLLPFAVSKHGIVVSGHNQLYMVGGELPNGSASRFMCRFDPMLNVWQEMAPLQTPRSELGLALLDGFIYAVGGWEGSSRLDSVERYEIETNTWSFMSPMKLAVASPAVTALDGALFVCGGAVLEDGDGTDAVQRLDVRTGEWSEVASMLIPRSGSAAVAINNSIYVIGGWHESMQNTNKVERYDIQKNLWTFACPMHERRYRPGATVLGGKLYVLGGEEAWDRYHDSVEAYDPADDRWVMVTTIPSARSWLSCGALKVKADGAVDSR